MAQFVIEKLTFNVYDHVFQYFPEDADTPIQFNGEAAEINLLIERFLSTSNRNKKTHR